MTFHRCSSRATKGGSVTTLTIVLQSFTFMFSKTLHCAETVEFIWFAPAHWSAKLEGTSRRGAVGGLTGDGAVAVAMKVTTPAATGFIAVRASSRASASDTSSEPRTSRYRW